MKLYFHNIEWNCFPPNMLNKSIIGISVVCIQNAAVIWLCQISVFFAACRQRERVYTWLITALSDREALGILNEW